MNDKAVNIIAGIVLIFSLVIAWQAFSFSVSTSNHINAILSR